MKVQTSEGLSRGITVFALILTTVLILTGCATAAPPPGSAPPVVQTVVVTAAPAATPKPVTLTIWQFGTEGQKRADDGVPWSNWWQRKVAEFESQNPNI